MKNYLLLSLLVTTFILFSCKPKDPYKLVWADEFEKAGLPDTTKWTYDTEGNAWSWGNNEAQYYTKADIRNAVVSDGTLKIIALKDSMEGKAYTSARLVSSKKGDWLYGKFEMRAKLPVGRGLWPAFWMLSTDWEYGGWPDSGEIDIMEQVGYDPDTIVGSAHTKKYNHVIGTQKNNNIFCGTCDSEFHTYGLEWEPEEYRIYLDGKPYFTFRNEHTGPETWPFDKRFHLILNLAVGGNWGGKMGIEDNIFPAVYEIDYVRVWQK